MPRKHKIESITIGINAQMIGPDAADHEAAVLADIARADLRNEYPGAMVYVQPIGGVRVRCYHRGACRCLGDVQHYTEDMWDRWVMDTYTY